MDRRLEITEAARGVFLRLGFRRTTMGDIAEAAKLSRPTLYLAFPSKESVFQSVLASVFAAELEEIRARVAKAAAPADQLLAALDVWCVRNYELTTTTPGARDLYESALEHAREEATSATSAFEDIVSDILERVAARRPRGAPSPRELAQLVSSAIVGLKSTAANAKQLRKLTANLVAVVLASRAG